MTDLTEQLKAGELYYAKMKNGKIVIRQAHLYSCLRTENAIPFVDFDDNDIEKVMAPVPSYEEYLESESHCAVYSEVNKSLKAENAQLKELLKRANKFLKDYGFTFDGKDCAEAFKVHTKINEVLK